MKIETKYNFGDTVYCIVDNELSVEQITSVRIVDGEIRYNTSNWLGVREDELFATKEEVMPFAMKTLEKLIDDFNENPYLNTHYKLQRIKSICKIVNKEIKLIICEKE